MLNIIPAEEKKRILAEYHMRLAVVAVFAVATLVFVSLILLIPSYLFAVSKYNFIAEELARLEQKQNGVSQEKEVDAKIKEVNKKIDLFLAAGKAGQRPPSEAILGIIATKGSGIKVQSISYEMKPDRERIVLSGRADNRDELARFVEMLKRDPSFSKVDLPIGSYVKSFDIDFSLVLEHFIKTE
ncbi:MAG: hypothetical protein ACYCZ7_00625 [Minisyncoccota bacterium]